MSQMNSEVNRCESRGVGVLARRTRVAMLLVASACAAVVGATTAPAGAEPTDPETPDIALVRELDRIGIRHPNDRQAVAAAGNVCQRIRDGFSADETVADLEEANPGLAASHAEEFVQVARSVYCPGVGVGQLPGYPGQT